MPEVFDFRAARKTSEQRESFGGEKGRTLAPLALGEPRLLRSRGCPL